MINLLSDTFCPTLAPGNLLALDEIGKIISAGAEPYNISITGNSGSVTNGVYDTGSYVDPSWITSLDGSKITGGVSGNTLQTDFDNGDGTITTGVTKPLQLNISSTFTGAFRLSSDYFPIQLFESTTSASDEKFSSFIQNSSGFYGALVNDALDDSTNWIEVSRSGFVPTSVNFPNGLVLQYNGNEVATQTYVNSSLSAFTGTSNIVTVGNIISGTWSGLFGAVSGANLTNLTAANIDSGTANIDILGNAATVTTNANLTGPVTSVGNASSITAGSITNTMLAGSITASKLVETDIVLSESQVTNLITDLASKLNLSGGTMTGGLVLSGDPTSSLMAATKDYVDMLIAGFNQFVVNAASTASLSGTYSNGASGVGATFTLTSVGAFFLDGQAGVLNGLYLLKDQTSTFENGIYKLTTVGNGGTQAILTRPSNYDSPTEITAGDIVNVAFGTVNAAISYMELSTVTTVGTDPITFSRWGGQSMSFLGDVTGSGFSPVTLTIGAGKVTNAMLAGSIDLTSKVTNILPSANGGTANAFFTVSGPASSAKTFTFPNASCSVLTTNAAVTEAQGGTNQTAYTLGDTLYASAANTLSKLAGNTTTVKQYLSQTGAGSVSAAPVWAAISGADVTGAALTKTDDTNVTLTLGGSPSTALLNATSITVGWTGTLAASRVSFNSTNLQNSAGSLNTIQDIATSSSPAFSGLNVSSLTASTLVATDGSKNLISGALTGDVTTSALAATVVKINGATLGTTTPTAGNILIASGSDWGTHAMAGDMTMNLLGTTTIGANKVTFAKFQQVGANNLVGNATGSLANATGISLGSTLGFSGSSVQTLAITGDITASANSFVTTITTNAVTYAKFQQVGANNLVGNATGSLANATGISLGSTLAFSGSALQTAAITGDVTASANSFVTTLTDNAVTLAKMAQMATASFLGRNTASTGNVEVLSTATAKTMLNLSGTNSGDLTFSGENYLSLTGQALTASAVNLSGSNATGTLAAGRFPALTGDITTSAGALATTIAANAVTYAKFQTMVASSLHGNPTGSTATSQAITLGTSLTFSGTTINTIQGITTTSTPQFSTLGLGATAAAATITSQLNIFSATQNSARIILSGQEFSTASNTSSDGIGLLLGINRAANKQLWIVNSAASAVNSTNVVLRLYPASTNAQIDCIATDGATVLPIIFGNSGAATTISGSAVNVPALTATGVVVTDSSKNLTTVTAVSTYTPTIGDGTNNFTVSTATGTYYKIGHIYFVQLLLVWTGKGSASAGAGIRISIPTTMGTNQTRLNGTIGFANGVSFTGSYLTCVGGPNTSYVNLYGIGNTGSAPSQVLVSNLSTSGEIEIQFTMFDN